MAKSQIKQKSREATALLKRYQRKNKLSMKDLGTRLGISPPAAASILNGERKEMRYATIDAIHKLVANGNGKKKTNGNGSESTALVPASDIAVLERLQSLASQDGDANVKISIGPIKIELPVSALS
jgi:transcriptional regulator with XRE-family HTH domain